MLKKFILFTSVVLVTLVLSSFTAVAQDDEVGPNLECDPFLSGIASFIIPGWGQWINNEKDKAVMHIAVSTGLGVGAFLLRPTTLALVLALGRAVVGFYSTYDAFSTCVKAHDLGISTE